MGLYDSVTLPAEFPLPGLDREPSTIEWQTKSIGRPALRTFRVTAEGRLLEETFHIETVPETERPYHGTEAWEREDGLARLAGSTRRVHDGWCLRQYHGVVRLVASVDGDHLEYEAKFTDGRLVAVRDAGGNTDRDASVDAGTATDVDDDAGRERDARTGEWCPVDLPGDAAEPLGAGATSSAGSGAGPAPGSEPGVAERVDPGAGTGGDSAAEHGTAPATATGARPTAEYDRTAMTSLVEAARAVDTSLPADALTDSRRAGRYLQVLYLPDDRRCDTDRPGRGGDERAAILRRGVHELALREPVTVEDDEPPRPVSRVVDRDGPYDRETAIDRAVAMATERGLPIHRELVTLRPARWTAASDWVGCPDCGGAGIVLVTALDERGLTLACRDCEARATDGDPTADDLGGWLGCPSCSSGDVDVTLSAPRGTVWWSCDDCGYDMTPAPTDRGYTRARSDSEP